MPGSAGEEQRPGGRGRPGRTGRWDAHLYVDLLADAAIACGRTVRLPELWAEVARSKAKTQLARACRRVPQPPEAAT